LFYQHLLVAPCTTSLQSSASASNKIQQSAKSVGCGCAKAFFPTTSNKKQPKPEKQAKQQDIPI
jgi:hypothetical protein